MKSRVGRVQAKLGHHPIVILLLFVVCIRSAKIARRQTDSDRPVCGVSTFSKFIVNGLQAEKGAWPWLTALIRKDGLTHFCGGSLISNQYVLTAAHCCFEISTDIALKPEDMIVRLGAHNLRRPSPDEIDYDVESFKVHPVYIRQRPRDGSPENDIAILKLKTRVQMTNYIQPICLPLSDWKPDNQYVFAAGWGLTQKEDEASFILRQIDIFIRSGPECERQTLTQTQLCAGGSKDGGKDTCRGDSGGPLMLQNSVQNSLRWEVVGVVSYGSTTCGRTQGYYTAIASYLNWIRSIISSSIRIGCPNGYKNVDEITCVKEYFLERFTNGEISWNQVLEARELLSSASPIRSNSAICSDAEVEFDEFHCVTIYVYESYFERKDGFTWDKVVEDYLERKEIGVISDKIENAFDVRKPFSLNRDRRDDDNKPCPKSRQIKFDERYCVPSRDFDSYKKGNINWHQLLGKRVRKENLSQ